MDVSLDHYFLTTISCVSEHRTIQYAGMTQDALRTKWKFVVEFGDEETHEISGTIGDFLSLICSTIIRMDESS